MRISLSPVTRIEGHLDIEATVEDMGGQLTVVEARSAGTMFRGFETILIGRDPRDAVHISQRICGVCPVSHALASAMALESAAGVTPTDNGRLLRNLVLGANYLQSHILHLYHLALPDWVDTTGALAVPPWTPRMVTDDMIGGEDAKRLVAHYVEALGARRKAHQMGALFAGRLPCPATFVPSGCTDTPSREKIDAFAALLDELRAFVDQTMIPDIDGLGARFPAWAEIGKGPGNLLAFGAFDLDGQGARRLFPRGRLTDGKLLAVDEAGVREQVRFAWLDAAGSDKHPSQGVTLPAPDKDGAYSWVKAPRLAGAVHELGPLARLWISGAYREGISVLDRLRARALEARVLGEAMAGWLGELEADAPSCRTVAMPAEGAGAGLTEAARGALGHWIRITDGKIAGYQVITPTAWNASPRDDAGVAGALEQALVGTVVADPDRPVELLRVVHSFDPCLACAVHLSRPAGGRRVTVIADGAA